MSKNRTAAYPIGASDRSQLARMSEMTRAVAKAVDRGSLAADLARDSRFIDWVKGGHFIADREPIDFDVWRYLEPIYDSVPNDPTRLDLVIMKSAQGGASIFALLFSLWLALRSRSQIAYFLPTEKLARTFSCTRFLRMLRGNVDLHRLMGDQQDPKRRRITNEGSVSIRQILSSILHFCHIEGKAATEALPLDALIFDEVQEMLLADIEKAVERMSASPLRSVVRVSTATFPGASIDFFYRESDQRDFFTRCRCPDGVVLSDHFDGRTGAASIGRGNGSTPGVPSEPFYLCPRCGTIILNPQDGEFRPRNAGARRIGFHFPQLLSPRVTPAEILAKWESGIDRQNFFNRILGLPFADPSCMPVTEADLDAAQNRDLTWGPLPPRTAETVVMGIDHMGGVNYVAIKARVDGRMRLLHLEIVQSGDPFKRCSELMRAYRVRVAVVEHLPNFNEAHRFAREHDGRVFIATYQQLTDEMVRWSDRPRDGMGVRNTLDEVRSPWGVAVDQFKMMSWSLARWSRREVQTPDARTLTQQLRSPNGVTSVQTCRDVFWHHLQRVALVTEQIPGRENEHIYRSAVRKVGIDPHFAFANMLADVAWARAYGTSHMLFASPTVTMLNPPERPRDPSMQQIHDAMPEMFRPTDSSLNCGNCTQFDGARRLCVLRNLLVKPETIQCDFYDPQPEDGEEDY